MKDQRKYMWGSLVLVLVLVLMLVGWVTMDTTNLTSLTLEKGIGFTAQTSQTIVADTVITCLGTYCPIVAGGAVGTGSVTAGTAGDIIIITNTGSDVITITDTGTLMLSGNAALGQYDTLTLMGDGTNWIEVAEGAN